MIRKTIFAFLFCLAGVLVLKCKSSKLTPLQEGDIVFQTHTGPQSKAIKLATHSRFSHCGVIVRKNGKLMVFEAMQPVRFMPIDGWIKQGKDKQYVAMRLKSRPNDSLYKILDSKADNYVGRDYDSYFSWSDDEIYCSELVWKMYKSIGVELCPLKKFKDYDFTNFGAAKMQRTLRRYNTHG
jgi:hypothetical protein